MGLCTSLKNGAKLQDNGSMHKKKKGETQFETSLKEYQAKYKGIVAFDESDTYDVTPYLTFTDSSMTLVGNIKGYVVIGDKLIAPNNNTPNYGSVNVSVVAKSSMAAGPIQPGFRAFVNSSLTIKNGKYKSTMTLGRIVNGNSFAIKFVTKKKQFLWKKSVNASYSLNLGMSGNKGSHSNNVICPYGKDCTILNTPVETFGNPINVTVANFKSSRGNATGNANFKNVQIQ